MPVRSSHLPNNVGALWVACRCFGLQAKDINGASRMAISRATRDLPSRQDATKVENELWERLLERFRRHGMAPVGTTNSFTDELVMALLQAYRRVRPRLNAIRAPKAAKLHVIVEHVFIPTIGSVMLQFRGRGLGPEFLGPDSWYVPRPDSTPFRTVFDRWLRTAGLRTPYGISKQLRVPNALGSEGEGKRREAVRRQLLRWLQGKSVPLPHDVDQLVEAFAVEVEWLDDANAWKARLRLALAVQRACRKARRYFPDVGQVAAHLDRIVSERIVCDDAKVLASPWNFFAVRLLQLRLQREKKFDAIVAPSRAATADVPPDPTHEDVEAAFADFRRNANPGNWFLAHLEAAAHNSRRVRNRRAASPRFGSVDDYLLHVGCAELVRMVKRGSTKRRADPPSR